MEPMKFKWASSRVDLGYTELFCFPEVTSVFISSCDSVSRDSLVLYQENRFCLNVLLGIQDCSACNKGESSIISRRGGCFMGILELRQEPGVYCRVAAGMAI